MKKYAIPVFTVLFSKSHTIWVLLILLVSVLVAGYGIIFLIPKQIEFSYASKSCIRQLVIAPDVQKFNSDTFTATYEHTLKVGTVAIASGGFCIEPKTVPTEGAAVASLAPFGGWFANKTISIHTPKAPQARTADIVGKTISTAKPLKVQLSSADIVHNYSLEIAGKITSCKQSSAELSCDIPSLKLDHGVDYAAALYQTYNKINKKLVEGKLETLEPLMMTGASITNDQTLYDAPTSFTLNFDRPVSSSTIDLFKLVGDATESIDVTTKINGSSLTVETPKLAREASYRLTLADVIADNGSSFANPVAINFKTSGGPKVASVSVSPHSVARNASIVVTFDQPIDPSTDLAKYARIEGVGSSVRKQSDTQLVFSIQGGDCTAFSVIIDKGIKGGLNTEASKESWRFNSRTICGTSWVIGTSLKGQPIVAYSFGSGSVNLLFTGGIHGSEPSGYTTMQAWVQHLQAYGDSIPANKRVVIVPNTNPDGIAAGTRNNSRNVNVDRNFPASNWASDIDTASGFIKGGGGTAPGSEPETMALINITRQLKPRVSVSFHAQGRLVGANKVGDSVTIGDRYARTVGYKNMFSNPEGVMGYSITGEYEDWMGEEMGIPAILIELPTPSGNYLSSQLTALSGILAL
ncbi:MAG: DUF2817 domain-containing protein [Candidatus Microsaccharimonas sp.]